jgi:adenine C2-methylase RlmN of 23S rRNA A2503 and tRNA A37
MGRTDSLNQKIGAAKDQAFEQIAISSHQRNEPSKNQLLRVNSKNDEPTLMNDIDYPNESGDANLILNPPICGNCKQLRAELSRRLNAE